jgi:hypothetical protein
MIVYPEDNFDSFVSVEEAHEYFNDRLNAGPWDAADQTAALMTAYRSLQELNILIDLSDSTALKAIKEAQAEQALWELKHDPDMQAVSGVALGGILNVRFPSGKTPTDRYSPRALAMLRPYIRGRSVARNR